MPLLIRNVFIVDGSLRKPYKADVLVDKGHVLSVGEIIERDGCEVVEGNGRYLAPGFIDVEYKGPEAFVLQNREQRNYLEKGITTLVIGHKGKSLAPIFKGEEHILKTSLNRNWGSFRDFRETIKNNRYGVNFVSLVGDFNIRASLPDLYKGELTAIDKNTFVSTLYNSLSSGALGLSCSVGENSYIHLDDLRHMSRFVMDNNRIVSVSLEDEDFDKRREVLLTLLREKRKSQKGSLFIQNIKSDDISYLKRSRALKEIMGSVEVRDNNDLVTLIENDNLFATNQGDKGEVFNNIIKMGLRRQRGLTIESAVNKLTQKPALGMRLFDSYEIRSGFKADLILFNSMGNIDMIMVSGKNLLENGPHNLAGVFHYAS